MLLLLLVRAMIAIMAMILIIWTITNKTSSRKTAQVKSSALANKPHYQAVTLMPQAHFSANK